MPLLPARLLGNTARHGRNHVGWRRGGGWTQSRGSGATERPEALIPECVWGAPSYFSGDPGPEGRGNRRARGCAWVGRIFFPPSLTFGVARAAGSCRVSGASWGSTFALSPKTPHPLAALQLLATAVPPAWALLRPRHWPSPFPLRTPAGDPCFACPCWVPVPCWSCRSDPAPLPSGDLETP